MKFRVTQDVDYVQGYLRYGHFEGVIECDSVEELKKMIENEDIVDYLDLVIDDWSVNDYGDRGEYEWEVIND